jgi:hypothetical protein
MKIRFIFLLPVLLCSTVLVRAQNISINTTGAVADASAMLDITSTTKGFLAPRMSTVQRIAIASPATGLLVYDTTLNLFYMYDGTAWRAILNSITGWTLFGNNGTSPAIHFLGTVDNQPIMIRTNNAHAGMISYGGSVFIGSGSGEVNGNTTNSGFGSYTLNTNTTGGYNSAVGYGGLFSNTTGSDNNAFGAFSLQLNTTGYRNTAMGTNALSSNLTGFENQAFGYNALAANTIGTYNVAVGKEALLGNTSGTSNVAIGTNALHQNLTGGYNVAIGSSALYSSTVSNTVAIGY